MPCPICNIDTQNIQGDAAPDAFIIDCPRCGSFRFTGSFQATRPGLSQSQIASISGWIRERQDILLQSDQWETLSRIRPPTAAEKADKLLLLLARRFPVAGQTIMFHGSPEDISSCWASDEAEANYLFNSYLAGHKQFLTPPVHGGMSWKISPAGWDYIQSLDKRNSDSQIGFCAMWFDDRLEPLWQNGLEPAIVEAGYEAKRIDKHPHNNRIDDEIIAMIRRSRFVVCDLTGNRQGVYFESGFAMGLNLPVIWTCEKSKLHRVHFDNRQYNFVLWASDQFEQFRDELHYRIEATIGRGPL
jgi:hypothetical protein